MSRSSLLHFGFILLRGLVAVALVCAAWLAPAPVAQAALQADLLGPAGSGAFGQQVLALPNGNIVITDPSYSSPLASAVGAVYLYNGRTRAQISMLTGSTANDQVGAWVMALANGNFVVSSLYWNNGAAVQAGAVTWCSGATGCSGVVTTTNSLVGTTANDQVGTRLYVLTNGNYVVTSPNWTNGGAAQAGAATWCNGTTGLTGEVTSTNSLVGTTANDQVSSNGVRALANGNYLVASSNWTNGMAAQAGAVTWGNGTTGLTGPVTITNSLVGTTAGDRVGGWNFALLTNGNYVVTSPYWTNGVAAQAGAATWGNGTTGITGPVTITNSLVGTAAGDQASVSPPAALANGNYVIGSPNWNNGATAQAGAATWCSGATGCSGVVTTTNSLVGTTADDQVGGYVVPLTNGNYVVVSPYWTNSGTALAGAVTWGDGATGLTGVVAAANSLVGTTADDQVGGYVVPLTNGNYLVASSNWTNGPVPHVGAATWGDGVIGTTGMVTITNSLVGASANDLVGWGASALADGNYVVRSPSWANGPAAQAGAATWGNGTTGITGVVTITNSLVGTTADDRVAMQAATLANGNYLVISPFWNNGAATSAGAVTWCGGTSGITGVVTTTNSLVGTTAGDRVGSHNAMALTNGNYVVRNPYWTNGGLSQAGAVTLGDGAVGMTGPITAGNSVLGGVASGGNLLVYAYDYANGQLMVGRPLENRVSFFALGGLQVFGGDPGQAVPIARGDATPSTADGTDFGGVGVGLALTHTFTISNSNRLDLSLTGLPRVAISGPAASEFSVVVSPTTPIAGLATTTFQVRFAPTSLGARAATVTITSNDYAANPYTFTLQGTGAVATGLSLTAGPSPSGYGQVVTLTAEVWAPGPPTGEVAFYADGIALGTGALANGTTAYTTTQLAAGPHVLSAMYLGDSTYAPSTKTLAGLQTVNPAPLRVTASDQSRVYGAANPTFTVTYTGFVNGDTAAVLSGSPALTTTATLASPVGDYPIYITPGSLAAANYTLTFVDGTLAVTAGPESRLYLPLIWR